MARTATVVADEVLQAVAAEIPRERRPRHVAIIMDGNGRWAEAQGLPRIEGHRRGVETVRMATEVCARLEVEAVTLYCLSSENWKRPEHELRFLMNLLEQYLIEERRTLAEHQFRLQVIGRRDRLPAAVRREMETTLALCRDHRGMRVVLAIDYGGRDELTAAMRQIGRQVASGEIDPERIDEQTIARSLYTAGLPDPDLLIRTGGEFRVSNFLLWQISYAELWVTERNWPEFSRDDLLLALRDFASRNRRYGGLSLEG